VYLLFGIEWKFSQRHCELGTGLGSTLMDETNAAVIARLDRATQYSRDGRVQPRCRGVLDRPVKPGDDSLVVADVLPGAGFFPGALVTKQSIFRLGAAVKWIASLRSQ
jgi:hypothetical protein